MHNDQGGQPAELAFYPAKRGTPGLRRVFWFIALWCAGVAGAALLALPFEILMRMAMH